RVGAGSGPRRERGSGNGGVPGRPGTGPGGSAAGGARRPAGQRAAATSSTHVTPKRSVSIPYSGAQADDARGATTVEPSTSASQYPRTSSTSSPRTDTKNGASPGLQGRSAGTSYAMTRKPLGAATWPQTTRSASAGSPACPRSP